MKKLSFFAILFATIITVSCTNNEYGYYRVRTISENRQITSSRQPLVPGIKTKDTVQLLSKRGGNWFVMYGDPKFLTDTTLITDSSALVTTIKQVVVDTIIND